MTPPTLVPQPQTDGRGRGLTAAIEGFFAAMWLSWGGSSAPSWLIPPLDVAIGFAALMVVVGVGLAARHRGEPTLMDDPAVRRRYNLIVGAEFALLGVGAVILGALGLAAWITVWVCAGVGLHFLPLARLFVDRLLAPLGLAIVAVAATALIVGLTTSVAPSTLTGPATGGCLLLAGILTLSGGPRRGSRGGAMAH